MNKIQSLILFAAATFLLVLSLLLLFISFLFSQGGTTNFTSFIAGIGLFFILPGIFCGIAGFLTIFSKENKRDNHD